MSKFATQYNACYRKQAQKLVVLRFLLPLLGSYEYTIACTLLSFIWKWKENNTSLWTITLCRKDIKPLHTKNNDKMDNNNNNVVICIASCAESIMDVLCFIIDSSQNIWEWSIYLHEYIVLHILHRYLYGGLYCIFYKIHIHTYMCISATERLGCFYVCW